MPSFKHCTRLFVVQGFSEPKVGSVQSSWGILLLWVYPDNLLHPSKLSASTVSVFYSSAPYELKNNCFTVFMSNLHPDSLVPSTKQELLILAHLL